MVRTGTLTATPITWTPPCREGSICRTTGTWMCPPPLLSVIPPAARFPQAASPPQVECVDLSVAQVLLDPGIVVVLLVFRDPVPGIEEENDVVPIESEIRHQAVPASGLRFCAAIGLVIHTDLDGVAPEAEEMVIGADVEQKLGLEIGP